MSFLDLTLEAGIPDDVIWPLIDGKYIVSVSHHDGLLVDRVDDGLVGSKRHILEAVERSQRTQAAVQIVSNLPAPSNGGPIYRFWACRSCGPAGWLALLFTKAGDVETNPGPTTLNKQVWICKICHKQIQVRKQISIICNRIEHWVHLRCAGIR